MRALKTVVYLAGVIAGAVYMVNPTAGVFEILPDNLPLVGNLDEAAVVTIILACLRGLRGMRDESKLAAAT